ncbi:MAG: DUF11 domain-containing protein [Planctomycetota bacterium]
MTKRTKPSFKNKIRRLIGVSQLLCASGLLTIGCAVPAHQNQGFQGPPRSVPMQGMPMQGMPPGMAGGPMTGMPGMNPGTPMMQMHMTGAQMTGDQLLAAQAMPNGQSVAQVGFRQPFMPHGACGPGMNGALGNAACAPCGPVTPFGYAMPPMGPWTGHDPQEYLCDGGDHPPVARLNREDEVDGLQAEDTVVHYVTDAGDIEFQASNRACLYAPRFASVRRITSALAGGRAVGLRQVDMPVSAGRFEHELPGLVLTESTELGHADVARRIDAMREQIRGVPVEGILQLEQTGEVLEALAALSMAELRILQEEEKALLERYALAAIMWELDESVEVVVEDLRVPTLTRNQQVQGFTIYEFPDAGRLQISKLADRSDAQPGDVVQSVLRVENVGDSTVSDVTLIDNLTTRLEYVDGSQTSSRDAEFEVVPNESQSLRLKWKLKEPLKVGEDATIRFECKVR